MRTFSTDVEYDKDTSTVYVHLHRPRLHPVRTANARQVKCNVDGQGWVTLEVDSRGRLVGVQVEGFKLQEVAA